MMKEQSSLRVVMIIQAYPLISGGAERLLQSTVPFLRDEGANVHIITRQFAGQLPYELIDHIPVYRLPMARTKMVTSLLFTIKAQQLIGKLRPDVIHAHEIFSPTTTAVLAKWIYHIPVVTTLHGGGDLGDIPELRRRTLGNLRLQIFRKMVDKFIMITREIEQVTENAGIRSEKRVFISNGVNAERFHPVSEEQKVLLRERLGLLAQAPIFIFTGRLVPLKRVNHLVSIWDSIREVFPDATLIILGSGEEEDNLRKTATAGIHLLGGVGDVLPYLQAADGFVLPSIAEGLSIAILEAMACGLPVIATQVGGNLELITHGQNGWLIPPDDPEAIRNAILMFLRDKELRSRIGHQAMVYVNQNYTIAENAKKLYQLYRSLQNRRLT